MDRISVSFDAPHDVRLTYHRVGAGTEPPVICVPGGPMLDTDYLGDLGGMAHDRALALLDLRGTGSSDRVEDVAACRCDRLADDVEVLRAHLGLDEVDLLGHSAGANVLYRYAERHPERVGRLVLITPSVRALDFGVPDDDRRTVAHLRADEPWYPEAIAALEAMWAGIATDAQFDLLEPFSHQRWDESTRHYVARMDQRRDGTLAAAFGADGAFDPPTTIRALKRLDVPVLVLAGSHDVGVPPTLASQVAEVFPRAEFVVQPEAGHFPWVDDPEAFRRSVGPFLLR